MSPIASRLLHSEAADEHGCCPHVGSVSSARQGALRRIEQSDCNRKLSCATLGNWIASLHLVAHMRKENMTIQIKSASPTKSAEPGEFIVKLLKHSLALLLVVPLVLATAPAGFA